MLRTGIASLVAALALGLAANAAASEPTGKRVSLVKSDYGRILADGKGFALYLFTKDDGKSRCYGECARAWPPLYTKRRPRAVGDVRQDLLGTVRRRNGRKQVTYNGHPLYYYVGDEAPRVVRCQSVYEYGGTWFIVRRSGRPGR